MRKFGYTALAAVLLAVATMMVTIGVTIAQSDDADTQTTAATELSAALVGNDSTVRLTWTPGQDLPEGYAQLVTYRDASVSPANWTAWVIPLTSTSSTGISTKDRFLPGETYIFQVAVVMSEDPVVWGFSNEVSLTMPEEASAASAQSWELSNSPSADGHRTNPRGLTATRVDGGVRLDWTPGTNPNFVKQIVRRRVAEITPVVWTDVEVEVSSSTFTDTTVTPGEPYIYRVRAEKINGVGSVSNSAGITAPGAVDTRVARDLSVEIETEFVLTIGGGENVEFVVMRWTAPPHPSYTRMDVRRRVDGVRPASWTNLMAPNYVEVLSGVTTYMIDERLDRLQGDTTYIYRVNSLSVAGKRNASAPVRITTPE